MLVQNADGHRLTEVITLPEIQLPTLQPIPLALVLARNGRRTLLVFNRHKNYWELPGGMLDPGETFRECAVRELFEETGQFCAPTTLTFAGALRFQLVHPSDPSSFRQEFGALFTASIDNLTPFVENAEVSAIEWWDHATDIGHIDAIDRWLACRM